MAIGALIGVALKTGVGMVKGGVGSAKQAFKDAKEDDGKISFKEHLDIYKRGMKGTIGGGVKSLTGKDFGLISDEETKQQELLENEQLAAAAAAEEEDKRIKLQQEKVLAEVEKRKQQSSVPGMNPDYGAPVFNPTTQQQMGALSGANPGPDPSLPIQEADATANALSTLYS